MRVKEFKMDFSKAVTLEDGYAETFYSRGGNDMYFYHYEVPKLDYTDEDISIEVQLTVKRGSAEGLILAGALCERNLTEECTSGLDMMAIT
jgi:hypothetical protein